MSTADSIGEYLVSARSFEEYRAMFGLTDADLARTVLDCPGGGSGFTATANERGCGAVAVDPMYADPPDVLATRLRDELDRGREWASTHRDRYVWDFYGDVDAHTRMRADAAAVFLDDIATHPDRYRVAELPDLPFPDRSFDLVLSSYLLFTYADRLDADFHRAALREMLRVARDEVRVFPLVDQAGRPLPGLLEALTTELAAHGVSASVLPVAYEFQHGADQLLTIRPS